MCQSCLKDSSQEAFTEEHFVYFASTEIDESQNSIVVFPIPKSSNCHNLVSSTVLHLLEVWVVVI